MRELSPRAVERLGQLLDCTDERIQLEAAKAILDRHLALPLIQADIRLHCGVARNRPPPRVGADPAGVETNPLSVRANTVAR
jgi:hypothetical protein